MQYFKIIAQDGHVFWLSDSINLDEALFVDTTEDDGFAGIFLQHIDNFFTYLAEYPTEERANAVLAEIKEAYRCWNSPLTDTSLSDNPVEFLKRFTAINFYELPEEDSNVDKNSAE